MPTVCRCSLQGTAPDEASRFLAESRAASVVDADRVVNNADIRVTDAAPAAALLARHAAKRRRHPDHRPGPGDNGGEEVASASRPSPTARKSPTWSKPPITRRPTHGSRRSATACARCGNCRAPRSRSMPTASRSRPSATAPSSRRSCWRIADGDSPAGSRSSSTSPRRVRSSRRSSSVRFSMRRGFASTIAQPTRRARRSVSSPPRDGGRTGEIDCPIGLGVPSPSWASRGRNGACRACRAGRRDPVLQRRDRHADRRAGHRTRRIRPRDRRARRRPARGLLAEASFRKRPMPDADPRASSRRSTQKRRVRLRGRLPEGAVGASVEAFAVSLFGRERTDLATRSVADLPAGLVGACHGGSARAFGAPRGADDA
jgi:OOP family OmpA-OmpF porin